MDDKRARFEAQVLPHLNAAYRYARSLARFPNDADDVLQEATLRAYRSFDDLRGTDGKAWLLTIVRNCHFTAARQRQRRTLLPLPDEHEAHYEAMIAQTPDPQTMAIDLEQRRLLRRLLAALPAEQGEVLVLREIEELDYRQIAAVIGVPIGTVMSRLARARAALRARWLQEQQGERDGVP